MKSIGARSARIGRLTVGLAGVAMLGFTGCGGLEDDGEDGADAPEVQSVQSAVVVRQVTDCASVIASKKVRATLDISVPGVAQAWTSHRPPTGANGTGGDWWAYASKTALADACNTAAYIRVKPHPTAQSLFFGIWAQADPDRADDVIYQGWPTPDFCQHSTLSWALYGKSKADGRWQLLTDPATGQPVWTRIFGVPGGNGKGQFCDHHEGNPPTNGLDQGVRFFLIPPEWNSLYSDFRLVASNWMHNHEDAAHTDCQKDSCFPPIHFVGAI